MAYVRFRPIRRQYEVCQQFNRDFDFDRLPNHVFIRILEQLEFRQRFKIARVNHRFKEMSDLSVTMIDSWDFDAKFSDLDKFREALGKFARYLRVASLNCTHTRLTWSGYSITSTMDLFDAISDLQFSRLADIEIEGWTDQVPDFLVRCTNLRRLKIRRPCVYAAIDFGQSGFPRVESVDFDSCSSTMIERVLNACPNVKHFSMANTTDETWHFIRWLYHFFAARLNSMESISLDFRRGSWEPPLFRIEFDNLWHLRPLRVLKIYMHDMTVYDMDTISNSFPNLQVLHLVAWRLDGYISTLSKLKNLINLKLCARHTVLCDIDICEFVMMSEADGLRRFEIDGKFSLPTVMNIIGRFSRLKFLIVRQLLDEDSTCSVISNFAKQLRRQFAQRDLKIVLFTENQWLWESRRVRRSIEKLRRAAGADERRPGLELDVHVMDVHQNDGGFVRRFGKRIEKSIVRMYHRIFC